MGPSFHWIEDLARSELHIESTGEVDFGLPTSETALMEEGTFQMLSQLRSQFDDAVKIFNSLRSGPTGHSTIKTYAISNTPADFMLFRNGLKLIIANTAFGIITVSFMSPLGGVFGASSYARPDPIPGGHQLMGRVGTFGDVRWFYQNEPLETERLVRHYLTQFIKLSSR